MNLLNQINAVFEVLPPPKEPLVIPQYLNPNSQGDEGATHYFKEKYWNKLDVEQLSYHRISLYMFTPQAFVYYLPAFLIASVKFPDQAGDIAEALVFSFDDSKEIFWKERVSLLTQGQRCVFLEVINQIADDFDREEGFVKNAIEILNC